MSRSAGTLSLALAIAFAGFSCGGKRENASGNRPLAAHAQEAYYFATPEEIVKASDLIVIGWVTNIEPGRIIGPTSDPDDPEAVLRLQNVTLQVDEVLKGTTPSNPIMLEEEPFDVEGYGPSVEGDLGFYFLVDVEDLPPPFFRVVNYSQSRFLVRDGKVVTSETEEVGGWVQALSRRSPAELREFILREVSDSSPSPSPAPRDPNEQLVYTVIEFARSPSRKAFSAIPLAKDGVWLGLGPRLVAKRSLEELSKPRGWVLDVEYFFRAGVGPFSALDHLAKRREVRVSAGPHPHCASPPMPPPKKFAKLDRLSVQPREWGSCLQWFTVDFFVSADGTIQAVTLDFWEP